MRKIKLGPTYLLQVLIPIFFIGCMTIPAAITYSTDRHYHIDKKPAYPSDYEFDFHSLDHLWFHIGHQISITFRTQKPYKKFHVKEISFERNGEKYYLLKNKHKRIPGGMQWIEKDNGGFYQHNAPFFPHFGFFLIGVVNNKTLRAFDDMDRGEEIEITVIEIYSFDNEPYRTRTSVYTVYRLFDYELGQT